jgi:hypothetical protein
MSLMIITQGILAWCYKQNDFINNEIIRTCDTEDLDTTSPFVRRPQSPLKSWNAQTPQLGANPRQPRIQQGWILIQRQWTHTDNTVTHRFTSASGVVVHVGGGVG